MKKYLLGIFMMIPVAISAIILFRTGYILDSNPSIHESDIATAISWLSLTFGTVAVVVGLIELQKSNDNSKLTISLLIAAVAICSVNTAIHCNEFRGYTIESAVQADYIDNEWFDGLTLAEIEDILLNADDAVVYIGREDCKDCHEFEKEIAPVLERNSVELPTYYTNSDREKSNNDEYRNFLNKYGIESVPFVIWTKEGKIQSAWDDPINSIGNIEEALR